MPAMHPHVSQAAVCRRCKPAGRRCRTPRRRERGGAAAPHTHSRASAAVLSLGALTGRLRARRAAAERLRSSRASRAAAVEETLELAPWVGSYYQMWLSAGCLGAPSFGIACGAGHSCMLRNRVARGLLVYRGSTTP
jgi:hypothetical protein